MKHKHHENITFYFIDHCVYSHGLMHILECMDLFPILLYFHYIFLILLGPKDFLNVPVTMIYIYLVLKVIYF